MNSKKPSLAALTSALAALPAYTHANGDETSVGYRFSQYSEGKLPASRAAGNSAVSRYDIQTHQLDYEQGLGVDWQLDASLMIESMSGASPWFVIPDSNNSGQAVQIMSGASIREERYAASASLQHDDQGDLRWGFTLGLSNEDDYESISGGVSFELDTDQRRRTWSAGLGISEDSIEPTDGGSATYPNRIVKADKRTWNGFMGVSQILTPQTVAQISLAYGYDSGYLSDPYKLVFVGGPTINDSRPNTRHQFALTTRVRHYLSSIATALRVDWRHFRDDWDIVSDTVEVGAWHRFDPRWRLGLSGRWYQQSQADFYGPFFEGEPANGLASSDYRMSPYGAISWRGSIDYLAPRWTVSFAIESYDSDEDYAWGSVKVANPGLVDFSVISIALSYNFGTASDPAGPAPREPVEIVPKLK